MTAPSLNSSSGIEMIAPYLYVGKEYRREIRDRIDAALNQEDCTFLGGLWIHRWTAMRFGGRTRALNLFLDQLARCPGIVLTVNFRHMPMGPLSDCDWAVGHRAPSKRVQVDINLDSEHIDVEKVCVPDIRGPREG